MVQLTNLSKKQTKQDKAIAKTSVDWKTGGLNPPAKYTKNRLKKTEKWQRVAIEACKQSGQNWLPLVSPPQNLKKLFESIFNRFDLIVIALSLIHI